MSNNYFTKIKQRKLPILIAIFVATALSGCSDSASSNSSSSKSTTISVAITQNASDKVTLTMTNNTATSVQSYSVSSITPSTITEDTADSTCANAGPFAPGASCTFVFTIPSNLPPGDTAGTASILINYGSSITQPNLKSTEKITLTTETNSYLYAGTSNSSDAVKAWNGSTWSTLGSLNQPSRVYALVFDNSNSTLYAGGSGSASGNTVEAYSSGAWSVVGTSPPSGVKALALDNSGNLYAGGNDVEEYKGNSWTELGGTGASPKGVTSMVFNSANVLYVADSGSSGFNNIDQFDGSTWSAVGTSAPAGTNALVLDSSGNLYAGGTSTVEEFSSSSGWASLGTPPSNVYSLAINSNLYAGSATGVQDYFGSWSTIGTSPPTYVFAMIFDSQGNLYTGSSSTGSSDDVEEYNGSKWSTLGSTSSPTNLTSLAIGSILTITQQN